MDCLSVSQWEKEKAGVLVPFGGRTSLRSSHSLSATSQKRVGTETMMGQWWAGPHFDQDCLAMCGSWYPLFKPKFHMRTPEGRLASRPNVAVLNKFPFSDYFSLFVSLFGLLGEGGGGQAYFIRVAKAQVLTLTLATFLIINPTNTESLVCV